MGKRGKQPSISHDARLQEMKKHNIFDEQGKVKKLSDPIWSIICNNLNQNQPASDEHINPKNLQRSVSKNKDKIKLELNVSELESTNELEKSQIVDIEKAKRVENRLTVISTNVLYKPIVKEIAFYPFSIFHGALIGINFVSDLPKNSSFIFTSVGSFCENFISAAGHSSDTIYLYSLGTIFLNQFVPIYQLSAERVSISLLNSFLNKSLIYGLPIPHRVIVHHCWIHYTCVNSCFNTNVTYEDYLNICFKYLTHASDLLPRCLINTDIRLLILKVKRWDCVQMRNSNVVRLFYLYCVIVLSKQDDVNKFQDIMQKIFVVTYSKFQSEHTRRCFNEIKTEIKNLKIDCIYSEKNLEGIESALQYMLEFENTNCKTKYIDYSECKTIYNYLTNIFAKAKVYVSKDNGNSNTMNGYYNPSFCKSLIQLCMEFILWSKVMLKDSYDAKAEENEIALIDSYKEGFKGHLKKKEPGSEMTVDKYLLENIEYVDNILETAINSTTKNRLKKTEIKFNPEISHLYHEENWRGLNKQEELECSSSGEECDDLNDSGEDNKDENDKDGVDSNHESNDDNETEEFSEENVSTVIESICEKFINDSMETNTHGNKKEDKNLGTAVIASKVNIITPMSSLQVHKDMDASYVNFKHDNKICTSSPGVHNKIESSILSSKDSKPLQKNAPKSKKQRGVYLQPSKQYELISQKPLEKPKQRKILKNCNELAPKKVRGEKQFIKTSSYFDSITEIFTTAYYTIKKFHDFMDSSKGVIKGTKEGFLVILYNYATTFNTRELYSARVLIIANICNASSSCYTWTKSVGEFFGELVGNSIGYKQLRCKLCDEVTYQHYNRIHLTREEVINENLSSIMYNSLQGEMKCQKCEDQLYLTTLETNNILCVDVEDSRNCTDPIELKNLIPTIVINEKKMILIGIVVFQEAIVHGHSRHYIAYCRSVESFWYEYNNSNTNSRISKVKDNLKLNVALLFYIEYDTSKITKQR